MGIERPNSNSGFANGVNLALNHLEQYSITGRYLIQWIERQTNKLYFAPSLRSTSRKPIAETTSLDRAGISASLLGGGGASEVLIGITPNHWPDNPTLRATLVHELAHVIRWMAGKRRPSYTHPEYDNIEEFFGTMMENMYWSELRPKPFPHAFGYFGGSSRFFHSACDYSWVTSYREVILGGERSQENPVPRLMSDDQKRRLAARFVIYHAQIMNVIDQDHPNEACDLKGFRRIPFNPFYH